MSQVVKPSINSLIKEGNLKGLSEELNTLSPFEIADLISNKSEEDQSLLFSALSMPLAIEAFQYFSQRIQKRIIHTLPASKAAELLRDLPPDERTNFLQDLPKSIVDELVKLLPYEEQIVTLTLLNYPEGSVGRLMTTDYLAVKMDWTVEQVLDHILAYGHDSETINDLYIIDNDGKLLDDFKIRELLFLPRKMRVYNISDHKFTALLANENAEDAIAVFQKNDRIALPVIDDQGKLLGIVTIDDILSLSNEEATEDIQKIGGVEALDEPYMQTPFLELMKKRAGWLVVLFVGEMFTASALSYFEFELNKAVVLALFLPLIISSGGNAGSQASTLIIRAMSLGEIKLRDWWRIAKREIASGFFLGTILGAVGFLRVGSWNYLFHLYGEHWALIGLTIFFSLIGVVLWGTLSGAMLPLILRFCRLDPATSSAPFVATLVDVAGVIIYFLTAILILRGTLL